MNFRGNLEEMVLTYLSMSATNEWRKAVAYEARETLLKRVEKVEEEAKQTEIEKNGRKEVKWKIY